MSYSGKATSSGQHQTAYWTRRGCQGSSHSHHLPAVLITEALQELPEGTYLFQQALNNADALDESGLDIFDSGPPYPTGPPSESPHKVKHTKRLVKVMHGRYMRMLRNDPEGNKGIWEEKANDAVEQWWIGDIFLASYIDGHCKLVML
jgi:hypothetical protein